MSAHPELATLTLAEAARRIAARELSPVELTRATLERIEALNGHLAAFITVPAELAEQQARDAEREIAASGPRSPLHGIPVALKDNIATAGVETTAARPDSQRVEQIRVCLTFVTLLFHVCLLTAVCHSLTSHGYCLAIVSRWPSTRS